MPAQHPGRPRRSALEVGVLVLCTSACTNDFGSLEVTTGAGPSTGGQAAGPGGSGTGAGAAASSSSGEGGREQTGGASSTASTGGSAAVPRHCKDVQAETPGAGDGDYLVDPDGEGTVAPFLVRCDMTTDGGGWTRFNWVLAGYPSGEDPLGQPLEECGVEDLVCRGRIPSLEVEALLVKDVTDAQWAAWQFDAGNATSVGVLGALRDKQPYCGVDGVVFAPYANTSTEDYCGTGLEGGCDSFLYADGASCKVTGGWALELDGDNVYCGAVFKMGATAGWADNTCGFEDWGFLNDCDCDDEHGELYFR